MTLELLIGKLIRAYHQGRVTRPSPHALDAPRAHRIVRYSHAWRVTRGDAFYMTMSGRIPRTNSNTITKVKFCLLKNRKLDKRESLLNKVFFTRCFILLFFFFL